MADTYIDIAPEAIRNIHSILSDNDMEGHGLRFGIRGGGCSGYSYLLEFAEGPEEGDLVFEVDDVPVYVAEFKRDFLKGTVIGYKTSDWEEGFEINNPNAKRPCGCGESFDIDDSSGGDRASA